MTNTPPPFLTSPRLSQIDNLVHGFFGKQGGVSRGVYESLNLGAGSRDDPAAVRENRARAARALGLEGAEALGLGLPDTFCRRPASPRRSPKRDDRRAMRL